MPFPIEKAATKKITDFKGGVEIYEILNYPVRGLVFEGGNSLKDLSSSVADTCICLQDHNIPYNVLISESGKRVFVLPQVKTTIHSKMSPFVCCLIVHADMYTYSVMQRNRH